MEEEWCENSMQSFQKKRGEEERMAADSHKVARKRMRRVVEQRGGERGDEERIDS